MRAGVGVAIVFAILAACDRVPRLLPGPIDDADPRYSACGGNSDPSVSHPVAAFLLDHHGEWEEHFPNAPRPTSIDPTNTFIVVFPDGWPGVVFGGGLDHPQPGHADICAWYGAPARAQEYLDGAPEPLGAKQVIPDVDVTGFRP